MAPLRALCERLKVPTAHRQLAEAACREHLNVHRFDQLRASTVHDLIARCDGFRRPERIDPLATVCEADARGRTGLEEREYPQADALLRSLEDPETLAQRAARAGVTLPPPPGRLPAPGSEPPHGG